jgi:hypothetical protein
MGRGARTTGGKFEFQDVARAVRRPIARAATLPVYYQVACCSSNRHMHRGAGFVRSCGLRPCAACRRVFLWCGVAVPVPWWSLWRPRGGHPAIACSTCIYVFPVLLSVAGVFSCVCASRNHLIPAARAVIRSKRPIRSPVWLNDWPGERRADVIPMSHDGPCPSPAPRAPTTPPRQGCREQGALHDGRDSNPVRAGSLVSPSFVARAVLRQTATPRSVHGGERLAHHALAIHPPPPRAPARCCCLSRASSSETVHHGVCIGIVRQWWRQ